MLENMLENIETPVENVKPPKGFAFVDKRNGNVDCVFGWNDGRELPSENRSEAKEYHMIVEIINFDTLRDGEKYFNKCFDITSNEFKDTFTVSSDKIQISKLDEIATITVKYPSEVNEICHISIDGQSVDIDIVNGVAIIPFMSQVVGNHNIDFESSTFYGKKQLHVEVI